MDWPKARLSLAYWDVRLMICFEPPKQDAPNLKRPIFKVLKALMEELPIREAIRDITSCLQAPWRFERSEK